MSDEEYSGLVEDIRAHGLLEAIWIANGQVVDGRNRQTACIEAGIEPRYREWQGTGSLIDFVIGLNLKRRHLTASQLAMIGADAARFYEEEAKEAQREAGRTAAATWLNREQAADAAPSLFGIDAGIDEPKEEEQLEAILPQAVPPANKNPKAKRDPQARDKAAKKVGVGERYVQDAKKIANAAPDLAAQVRAGTLTLPDAKREITRRERERKAAEPKPII